MMRERHDHSDDPDANEEEIGTIELKLQNLSEIQREKRVYVVNEHTGQMKSRAKAQPQAENDAGHSTQAGKKRSNKRTGRSIPGMAADPRVNVVRAAVMMEGPALKALTA